MKNHFKKLLFFGITVGMFFSSCGKYEDGPNFSLRSKKARLVNTWVIDKVLQDGVDGTDDFNQDNPNYQMDIRKDNSYTISTFDPSLGESTENKGKWKISKDKEEVEFSDDETGEQLNEEILRLTNTELWTEINFGFTRLELHYKSK